MTALKNDFHRANVREAKYARRTSSLRAVLCAVVVLSAALSGCDALRNHECCLFKPGGIFSQRNDEVERVRARDERDVIARATAVSNQKKEAWEPTESELSYARRNHVDLKNYVWATQKPNGGVLFPQKLPAPGPIVLMEPSVISAPVGTEIILVASYVDSDSQHLRVGEQLSWDLAGVGNFVSTNPRPRLVNLNLPWRSNSREIEGRSETTETSGQLYRITRGTKSPEDDVTILRGQSWMAVTSLEEGTSSVSVFSSTVPNWDYRRASAEIHWIDAAFLFPKSAVGAVDRPGKLETAIVRRSDSQALPNWRVRYEILSGDGGFNDGRGGLARSIDVLTGADGKANVEIRQSAQRGRADIFIIVFSEDPKLIDMNHIDNRRSVRVLQDIAVQVHAPFKMSGTREPPHLRPGSGDALPELPEDLVLIIEDHDILRCLILTDPLLDPDVFLHGMVAVQVIRRDGGDHGYVGMERVDGLQLEGADLRDAD